MPTIKQLKKVLRKAVSDGFDEAPQKRLDRIDTRVRLGVAIEFDPASHTYLVVPWEDYPNYTGGGPAKIYRCRSAEPLMGEEAKLMGIPRGDESPNGSVILNTPHPCIFTALNGVSEDMGFVVLGFLHLSGDRELGFKEGRVVLKEAEYYVIVDDEYISLVSPFARIGVKGDRVDISSCINLTKYGLESLMNVVVDNDGVHIRGGDTRVRVTHDKIEINTKEIYINGVKVDIPEPDGGE